MRASVNQFVARSAFDVIVLVLFPFVSWLCLFGVAWLVDGVWRSVATGVAMLLCAVATAGSLKRLQAPADLFHGPSVWKYFGVVLLQLLLFYLGAIVIGATLICVWSRLWLWLAATCVKSGLLSIEHTFFLHALIGVLTGLITPTPVWVGLWVVTHHHLTTFDVGQSAWSVWRERRP